MTALRSRMEWYCAACCEFKPPNRVRASRTGALYNRGTFCLDCRRRCDFTEVWAGARITW